MRTLTKSYDNAKQNFLNSIQRPAQANAKPIQQQQFQSAGLHQISKGLDTKTLRPITEGTTPSGGENER